MINPELSENENVMEAGTMLSPEGVKVWKPLMVNDLGGLHCRRDRVGKADEREERVERVRRRRCLVSILGLCG